MHRLLVNPSFSVYAIDNATAKAVDIEVRASLMRLKDGLLAKCLSANMLIRRSHL